MQLLFFSLVFRLTLAWMNLKGSLRLWKAFLRPVPGWHARYQEYLGGKNTWEVPGRPDVPKVVPFPVQWIPHRLDNLGPDDQARGFAFEPVVCSSSGKSAPVGTGVCCVRCGVPLHETEARMRNGFDAPKCWRCAPLIRWASL